MLFEIDPEPATETPTALGGIPLLGQELRSLGVPGSVKRQVRSARRERRAEWMEARRVRLVPAPA
jgi:hypothetical protein